MVYPILHYSLIIRTAENSQQDMWIGLVNPDGRTCWSDDCDGVIEWSDGTTYNHQSYINLRVNDASACVRIKLNAGSVLLDDRPCNAPYNALCQSDCVGFNFAAWEKKYVLNNFSQQGSFLRNRYLDRYWCRYLGRIHGLLTHCLISRQ